SAHCVDQAGGRPRCHDGRSADVSRPAAGIDRAADGVGLNPRTIVIGSWGGAAAIITIQWITSNQSGFPPPGRYLASGVVFSMLYLLAGPAPSLGAAVAAGTVFALLLQPYLKGKPGVLDQTATWLGKLSGRPAGA